MKKRLARGHDLGHACLVVRAQKRRAVGGDEGLADAVFEIGEVLRTQHPAGRTEGDVPAVIVKVELWLDPGAGKIRGSVDMGNEADHGFVLPPGACRQEAVGIGAGVCMDALHPQILQFKVQQPGKRVLLFRAGGLIGILIALRVDARIAQKTFVCSHMCSPIYKAPL